MNGCIFKISGLHHVSPSLDIQSPSSVNINEEVKQRQPSENYVKPAFFPIASKFVPATPIKTVKEVHLERYLILLKDILFLILIVFSRISVEGSSVSSPPPLTPLILPSTPYNSVAAKSVSTTQIVPPKVISPISSLIKKKELQVPKTSELEAQLKMLEWTASRIPISSVVKPRNYLSKISIPPHEYYPRYPLSYVDNLDYYLNLQSETLFFVFYYMEVCINSLKAK